VCHELDATLLPCTNRTVLIFLLPYEAAVLTP
jgi:hypothetical protein